MNINNKTNSESITLYVQYLESTEFSPEYIMGSATITRPTFAEAIKVLLQHIALDLDCDEEEWDTLTEEEIIENILYANNGDVDYDYITVLENTTTGEIIINQYIAPQKW